MSDIINRVHLNPADPARSIAEIDRWINQTAELLNQLIARQETDQETEEE